MIDYLGPPDAVEPEGVAYVFDPGKATPYGHLKYRVVHGEPSGIAVDNTNALAIVAASTSPRAIPTAAASTPTPWSGHFQRALRPDDPARTDGRRLALRHDPDRRPSAAPLGDPLRGRRLPGAAPRARRPDAHHPPSGSRQPEGPLPEHPQEMCAKSKPCPQALSEGEWGERSRLGLAVRGRRRSGRPRAPGPPPPRRARPRPLSRRVFMPKPCRRFPAASRSRSPPTVASPPRGPARTPTG